MRTLLIATMLALPLAVFAQQSGAQQPPGTQQPPEAQQPGTQQPAPQPSAIRLFHAWSRPAMLGHEGVVYLTITDTGQADTLTGASTPVAAMAGLHESINDNGVMKMRPVASLPIAPGKAVTLAPGGYHIMLMDLKQPLTEGETFPITLSFAKAGQVTATARVAKAGAAAMPGMDQGTTGGMGNMPMPGGAKQP
jgi:copper(I)-binding protein